MQPHVKQKFEWYLKIKSLEHNAGLSFTRERVTSTIAVFHLTNTFS